MRKSNRARLALALLLGLVPACGESEKDDAGAARDPDAAPGGGTDAGGPGAEQQDAAPGAHAAGEPCDSSQDGEDCASHICARDLPCERGDCPYTCRTAIEGPCSRDACPAAEFCRTEYHGSFCEPRRMDGESCNPMYPLEDVVCGDGLYCRDGNESTCSPRDLADGDECTLGSNAGCPDGSVCTNTVVPFDSDDSVGTCVRAVPRGDDCDEDDDCDAYLHCADDGTCQPEE